jgi:D-alanyl-D-alanine carboxypeptidase
MSLRTVVALATLAACHPTAPAKPKDSGPSAPTKLDPAAIDAWLASEVKRRGLVGLSVVVVHEGATVFAKGYGTKQLGTQAPIDPDTAFHVGSVGKQLTCGAVMLLATDGKLKLSDPVAKYFPNLVRAADITLDDLGAHMSGYRDYYPLDYTDTRFATPIDPDALIARYGGLPLDFEPRARQSYSNTGYTILGRVAEKVSGLTMGQLLEQRVFKPLGMTHSQYGTPPAGAASGHDAFMLGKPEVRQPEAAGWLLGAANVWASANDLAKWDLAFASGTLLDDAARRAMTAPHKTSDGREILYGCGLGTRIRNGEVILQHTGAVEGFQSYNTFVPRIRAAVIVLANDFHSNAGDLQEALVNLVLDRPNDIPLIPGPSAEATAMSLVRELQAGAVERSKLGDDLNALWTDKRIAEAAAQLRPLGQVRVQLGRRWERGNQEATALDLVFGSKTLHATMFRAPTGKIHQFLIRE